MVLERGCPTDPEYKVDELWDGPGPGPRYRVTARLKALSQDGGDQTALGKALIKSGVITRTRGFEFQIIDDEIRVLFYALTPAVIHIQPPIENAEMILSSYISRALDLASYVEALQVAGRCKGR
jgi:hypothetical protein